MIEEQFKKPQHLDKLKRVRRHKAYTQFLGKQEFEFISKHNLHDYKFEKVYQIFGVINYYKVYLLFHLNFG